MLDCTRDIARIEELTNILRTTDKKTAGIERHFFKFIAVETTA